MRKGVAKVNLTSKTNEVGDKLMGSQNIGGVIAMARYSQFFMGVGSMDTFIAEDL